MKVMIFWFFMLVFDFIFIRKRQIVMDWFYTFCWAKHWICFCMDCWWGSVEVTWITVNVSAFFFIVILEIALHRSFIRILETVLANSKEKWLCKMNNLSFVSLQQPANLMSFDWNPLRWDGSATLTDWTSWSHDSSYKPRQPISWSDTKAGRAGFRVGMGLGIRPLCGWDARTTTPSGGWLTRNAFYRILCL